jgi:hypothetical protein
LSASKSADGAMPAAYENRAVTRAAANRSVRLLKSNFGHDEQQTVRGLNDVMKPRRRGSVWHQRSSVAMPRKTLQPWH